MLTETMKYFFLLSVLVAFHDAMSADEAVSVRVKVNEGKPLSPGASCTRPELSRIQSTLVKAIHKISKKNPTISSLLRGETMKSAMDTSFCWESCGGAAPGSCWMVDARCSDLRQYWQFEKNYRFNSSKADLYPEVLLEDDLNEINRCHSDKQAIENAIQTILQSSTVSLTHSCLNMLRQQVDVTCVKSTITFKSQ
jgi:hypothetical protein